MTTDKELKCTCGSVLHAQAFIEPCENCGKRYTWADFPDVNMTVTSSHGELAIRPSGVVVGGRNQPTMMIP